MMFAKIASLELPLVRTMVQGATVADLVVAVATAVEAVDTHSEVVTVEDVEGLVEEDMGAVVVTVVEEADMVEADTPAAVEEDIAAVEVDTVTVEGLPHLFLPPRMISLTLLLLVENLLPSFLSQMCGLWRIY